MGSGSLAAFSVFESRWKPDMKEEEGKLLVRDAIRSGIFNDLGSESNVYLCVIRKDSCDYLRNYELSNQKGTRKLNYDFKPVGILNTKIDKFEVTEEVLPVPMEE